MKMDHNNSRSFKRGLEGISVELWSWPDQWAEARKVSRFYRSTWGPLGELGDGLRYEDAVLDAQLVAEGKALPNCLESVELTFGITGVSRATTHQLVRTRVGAGFGQQGGRDNDWSENDVRIPDSWSRNVPDSIDAFESVVDAARKLYENALAEGVPFQDARYILPMGLTTNLVATYNLLSLKGTLNRRLCNRMMWETNYVARLMHDLVVEAYPWVGRSLRSGCEKSGTCGSVSPMFPPSCWIGGHLNTDAFAPQLAKDNATLSEYVEANGYDWPKESNSVADHFDVLDYSRVWQERDPDIVMSLTSDRILAVREDGIWRNA